MSEKHESSALTFSPPHAIEARSKIYEEMKRYSATPEEFERSLGLFLRGSLLARIFAIDEIYRQIVDLPGSIFDIGTWRGQTGVVCENLRAIHEPLNFHRRIVCFDTFEGYKGFSDKDNSTLTHDNGSYSVGGENYSEVLTRLLMLHEQSNAMGHNFGKHKVIAGDCRNTIPDYFRDLPHEFVALAFFDVNAYDPTRRSFEAVWERLIPGGVAAFWQLSRDNMLGEGRVYIEECLGKMPHTVFRTKCYPGLCYIKKSNQSR